MRVLSRRLALVALLMISMLAAACGDTADDAGDTLTDGASEAAADVDADADEEEATEAPSDDASEGDAPAASGDAENTLVIWADERRIEPLQAIAPDFTEATGVEVQVELVPFDDIRDQVTQAAPAGEGPDLFTGAHDWTGELAANGVIAPVELAAKSGEFEEVAVNAFGFEGRTYAVPYVTEAVALYRNTDLVPDAPATFDELVTACTDGGFDPCLALPGGGGTADAYHTYPFLSAFGGTIFAYDAETGSYDPSTVRLDEDVTVQGAEFLASQVEAGIVPDTDYDTAKNLFLEGTAPFWITGPWELGGLRDGDLNFGVSIIPQIGDQPVAPFVGAQGFFLNQFSENQLIAQSFLLDFIATDEVMQALYDADPRGTAWVSVAEGLSDDPEVQTFSESAANGVPMPNVPEMASVWGPLGDNAVLIRSGELDGAQAMTTAAEAVRAAVGS